MNPISSSTQASSIFSPASNLVKKVSSLDYKIGIAVGIGIGLIFIGALAFKAYQARKSNISELQGGGEPSLVSKDPEKKDPQSVSKESPRAKKDSYQWDVSRPGKSIKVLTISQENLKKYGGFYSLYGNEEEFVSKKSLDDSLLLSPIYEVVEGGVLRTFNRLPTSSSPTREISSELYPKLIQQLSDGVVHMIDKGYFLDSYKSENIFLQFEEGEIRVLDDYKIVAYSDWKYCLPQMKKHLVLAVEIVKDLTKALPAGKDEGYRNSICLGKAEVAYVGCFNNQEINQALVEYGFEISEDMDKEACKQLIKDYFDGVIQRFKDAIPSEIEELG